MKKTFAFICALAFFTTAFAQLRKIPAAATDNLNQKYPGASGVEWKDNLTSFTASFTQDNIDYKANFNNQGECQSTEQEISEEDLPEAVKDGYNKSKYADWTISKVEKIELPDDKVNYRVGVASGDIKKRNLYFNSKGRMLKDKLTI